MGHAESVTIEYFTDVLCVWAYAAQARIDQLKKDFGDQIHIQYRFCPLFAGAVQRIESAWQDKNGFEGFNQHLLDISREWDHIQIHPRVWLDQKPFSSTGAHVFLTAVSLLQQRGAICAAPVDEYDQRSLCEEAIWRLRLAFFRDAQNIAQREVMQSVAQSLQLPWAQIQALIDNGEAYAALHEDERLNEQYRVPGSPTLALNGARQLLYGNVGYRIIEANLRELLRNPQFGEASWC